MKTIKILRNFFLLFLTLVTLQSFNNSVFAHGGGSQYVEINQEYIKENTTEFYVFFPSNFQTAADIAPKKDYLVKEPIDFEIDISSFTNPYSFTTERDGMVRRVSEDKVPQPVFKWSFGDKTPESEGFQVTHVYNQPGTYIITLQVKYPGKTEEYSTANTVQINIIPSANYQHPQARITFDGKLITEGTAIEIEKNKEYLLDASASTGKIKSFTWVLDDNTITSEKKTSFSYTDKDLISAVPVLRVIDENNITSDSFITLKFKENQNAENQSIVNRIRTFLFSLFGRN